MIEDPIYQCGGRRSSGGGRLRCCFEAAAGERSCRRSLHCLSATQLATAARAAIASRAKRTGLNRQHAHGAEVRKYVNDALGRDSCSRRRNCKESSAECESPEIEIRVNRNRHSKMRNPNSELSFLLVIGGLPVTRIAAGGAGHLRRWRG